MQVTSCTNTIGDHFHVFTPYVLQDIVGNKQILSLLTFGLFVQLISWPYS